MVGSALAAATRNGGCRTLAGFTRGLARGTGIALRSGVAPLFLGARLAWHRTELADDDVPVPRPGVATAAKIALDEFFFASELATAAMVSLRDRGRMAAELGEAVALFGERGWLDDPRGYHLDPPALGRVVIEPGRAAGLDFEHLRFESGYAPHADEPGRARWLSYEANRTAHAWVLRHSGPERPWVLCIPGYRMGSPLVDFSGFRARWLYRRLGLNLVIPVLPLHGPRRRGRRGGDGFFTGDFVETLHAQTQAVWDIRRLVTWLQDQGAPAVGVHGVSLGGYTTALVASLQDGLDCVIAGVPATDFVRLVRGHLPGFLVRAADRFGFTFDRIEKLLSVVSPFGFEPRVPRNRRYIYAGLVDRLTPPDQARDLWRHWGKPRAYWYHGGHTTFLFEPGVKALLFEAFHNTGLLVRAVAASHPPAADPIGS